MTIQTHGSYCLPLLLKRGFRYFWVDALFENIHFGAELRFKDRRERENYFQDYNFNKWKTAIHRGDGEAEKLGVMPDDDVGASRQTRFLAETLLAPLVGQDGTPFLGFKRFRGKHGPTAANFPLQVSSENLDHLIKKEGACVLYQHFGVWRAIGRDKRHASQTNSRQAVFDDNAIWAWRDLSERQENGSLLIATTARLLDFIRMRETLSFDVIVEDEKLIINIGDIECPVYGARQPTENELNGIAFEVPHDAPEVVVNTPSRTLPLEMKRSTSDTHSPVHIVYSPWERLTFPTISTARPTSFTPVKTSAPKKNEGRPLTKKRPQPFSKELATQWLDISHNWVHKRRTPAPGLGDDLQTLATDWDCLQFPDEFAPATNYSGGMFNRPLHYYEQRLRLLTAGGTSALDVGCGVGTWSFALANLFDNVCGIDTNRQRVDAARWLAQEHKISRVDIRYGDALDIPYKDNSFDFIFCYSVVVSALPLKAALRELKRVARPGARIYLCLNGLGWLQYLRDERGIRSATARTQGLNGLYNTFCQQIGNQLVEDFSSAIAEFYANSKFRHELASELEVDNRDLAELIKSIFRFKGLRDFVCPPSCNIKTEKEFIDFAEVFLRTFRGPSPNLKSIAEKIRNECGEFYVHVFANDLFQLFSGSQVKFSHSRAGRSYDPLEAQEIATECGLTKFEWSHEGGLLLNSAAGTDLRPLYAGEFNTVLNVWEFVCQKPD